MSSARAAPRALSMSMVRGRGAPAGGCPVDCQRCNQCTCVLCRFLQKPEIHKSTLNYIFDNQPGISYLYPTPPSPVTTCTAPALLEGALKTRGP